MSSSASHAAPSDQGNHPPVDSAARGLLLLLVSSALLWLIAGGSLALVHSIQTHTPGFFGVQEWLSFGRMHAAAQTALVYGWAGNAGFAVIFWLLIRLGNGVLRGVKLAIFSAVAWNMAVSASLIGILAGDLTGHAILQIPSYLVPVFLVSAVLLGAPSLFAWSDRRSESTYVSHGYAALSLFVLPWLLSVFAISFQLYPSRGVLTAVVAAWLAQNLLYLWLTPIALAITYYLVPKITGRPVGFYGMAVVGFWILMVFAPWTGTRILSGGPFPVWIPTVGISAGFVLLAHHAIVLANLSDAFASLKQSYVLRFLAISVLSYAVVGLLGAVTSLRIVSQYLQFTYWTEGSLSLFLLGVFSPAMFAAIYFIVPRLTGRQWASDGLIVMHFRAALTGLLLEVAGLAGAGVAQGILLSSQDLGLSTLQEQMKPWLLTATAGSTLQLLGAVFMVVNYSLQLLPQSSSQVGAAQSSTSTAS